MPRTKESSLDPESSGSESDNNADVDAPRVVQWVDEDDLEAEAAESSEAEESEDDEGGEGVDDVVGVLEYSSCFIFHTHIDLYERRSHSKRVGSHLLGYKRLYLTELLSFSDLSSLPFGALQKAQRVLAQTKAYSDSEDDNDGDEGSDGSGSEPEEPTSRWSREEKGKAKEEKPKSKKDITKRSSKHAYVSSQHISPRACTEYCLDPRR